MDGWMDGRTDRPSYRDAMTHLKTTNKEGSWFKGQKRFSYLVLERCSWYRFSFSLVSSSYQRVALSVIWLFCRPGSRLVDKPIWLAALFVHHLVTLMVSWLRHVVTSFLIFLNRLVILLVSWLCHVFIGFFGCCQPIGYHVDYFDDASDISFSKVVSSRFFQACFAQGINTK